MDEERQADLFGGPDSLTGGKRPNPMRALFGEGPIDTRCGSCRFLVRYRQVARWAKCSLRLNTGGRGTDHLVSWPTCAKYDPKEDPVKQGSLIEEAPRCCIYHAEAGDPKRSCGGDRPSDRPSGRKLRDDGAASVETNAGEEWKALAAKAIAAVSMAKGEFTADDVRAVIGNPPHHPSAMSAAFLAASKRGEIVSVGFKRASRPERHASYMRVWRKA